MWPGAVTLGLVSFFASFRPSSTDMRWSSTAETRLYGTRVTTSWPPSSVMASVCTSGCWCVAQGCFGFFVFCLLFCFACFVVLFVLCLCPCATCAVF